jgi:streptogrisin D
MSRSIVKLFDPPEALMRLVRLLVVAGMLGTLLLDPTAVAARSTAPVDPLAELRRSASIAGTAWWTDPASGAVLVSADATVMGSDLARVAATADRAGARLIREPGTLARRIAGGDLFFAGVAGRCNIGFNVRQASTYYFLTSAHCVGAVGSTVYADAAHTVVLGVVTAVDAGHDYALVRYTNAVIAKPSAVNLYNGSLQRITSVAAGFVGQSVRRSGATTGVRSGTITGLNATVNYAEGTVTGLIRTNVCAEAGDSGGPLFSASTALGMTSGGSGNCASGGTTYFSSAQRAMSQYAVSVY